MILYLTSSFIPFEEPASGKKQLLEDNYGFFEDLKSEWPKSVSLLYIPCDPSNTSENEGQKDSLIQLLKEKDLAVSNVHILKDTDKDKVPELINKADVIYLAGGHAPTQLSFMKRMKLKEALMSYKGIVIGLSAGSMNAAYNVYLIPELPGEAIDSGFVRFSDGLDLTNVEIIPHAEMIKNTSVDGQNLIEDIILPDSYGSRFYLITDGSYFKVKNYKTIFRGEGEIIENGNISPLKQGTVIPYMGIYEQPVIKAILEDGFDMIASVNITNDTLEIYHLSDDLTNVFENSSLKFRDVCQTLSKSIVENEREIFLDNIRIPFIINELKERGVYVRTVHVDYPYGQRAKNIRVRRVPGYPDWLLIVLFDITTAIDFDWMTDEYTRTGFMKRARLFLSELGGNGKFSLVYTNVKGFKAVNELYGDQNGDMVIFQTRDALRKYLKPVIMGRLESDHFVLITSDENLSEANLKDMCNQTFTIESKEFNYEIRCGIYSISNLFVDITQILAGAKLAENNLKAGIGNKLYAYYDDVMKESYVKKRFLLSDFERGINDNEFEPYYQPIVDAKTGMIASAEVLIRWKHKDFGMVSPGEFIPIIESEGKTSILDNFIVTKGMDLILRRCQNKQKMIPCAFNLSRVDFYDTVFIESILNRVKDLKLEPKMLRFEVTESAYADLESKAIEYLNEMRSKNIQILLDDYGSGMSSLSMLQNFNFDIIKLDMGFIRKIGLNDKVEAIIITTIGLAHMIGAKVTAEGVETNEQVKFLRDYDCDYIQGYYFYKPMPEAEFEELLNGPDISPSI